MNADNVVKNVAKGLALGVLWPSAAVYVVGKRASKWMSELSHQSLDVAMDWSMAASDGVGEATHAIGMRWLKQPAVTKKANVARSVGAASADDPNVTGRRGWKLFGSDETKKEKDDQDKKERNLYTIAGAIAGIAGAVGYAYFVVGVVTIWAVAPLWTKLLVAFPFATVVSISVMFMARMITIFIVRVFTTPSPSVSIMS